MKLVLLFGLGIFMSFGYVCLNLFAVVALERLPWNEIRQRYIGLRERVSELTSSREVVLLSVIVTFGWIIGLLNVRSAASLASYTMSLIFLGFAPIAAFLIQFDKLIKTIEPQSKLVNWSFTVCVAAIIWFLKAMISDLLNEMFPFDPASMPVGWSSGIFLAVVAVFSIVVLLIAFPLQLLVLFGVIGVEKNDERIHKRVFKVLLLVGLYYGAVSSAFSFHSLTHPKFARFLISRIVFEFDFNSKHRCYKVENGEKMLLDADEKVLFLGATQSIGIAARAKELPAGLFYQINFDEYKNYFPSGFHTVICNDPNSNHLEYEK